MMHTADVLKAFQPHRGDAIVVPGRGGRHWHTLSGNAMLDAPVGDPAMGGHAVLALGLALARPDLRVVLFDSEGDILMSLGMLVTIAEQAPANFYHFLLDNECYATTGGQPVPGGGRVDFAALALSGLGLLGFFRLLLLQHGITKCRLGLLPLPKNPAGSKERDQQ